MSCDVVTITPLLHGVYNIRLPILDGPRSLIHVHKWKSGFGATSEVSIASINVDIRSLHTRNLASRHDSRWSCQVAAKPILPTVQVPAASI